MKKIRFFIIIIIVLNILCIILQLCLVKLQKQNTEQIAPKIEAKTIEENRRIYPIGSYKFTYSYHGDIELDNFYGKIFIFVKYLENIKTDIDGMEEKDIEQYIKDNKEKIIKYTYIEEKDIETLINQIREYDIGSGYSKIEMLEKTYKEDDKYCSIQINISYQDGNTIKLMAYFSRKYSNDRVVKFVPLKKES